jgi:uncharacterized protein
MGIRKRIAAGLSLAVLAGAIVFTPVAAATLEGVAIPGAGHDIPGTLVLPDAATDGPVPAVLMLHGYGSSADEVGDMYARLAFALGDLGVASLRIDFAGMGASQASTLDYTYDSMTADASAALDWLASNDAVDPERIGVQGFSMGSMIGAHLVGTDERPAAFGSWSGAIYDGDQFFYGEDQLAACEAEGHLDMDLGFRTLDHSCEFFSSGLASTALSDFAPFDGALLLIAGTADETVDPAVSQNAATASASTDVTVDLVDGADHIYAVLTEDQTMADYVIDTTAAWYAEKL